MRSRRLVAGLICAIALATSASSLPIPSCADPGVGWCIARRISGETPGSELGFRFGDPLDVDGDRHADIAAGSRFTLRDNYQAGRAAVWSGATGSLIRAWDGEAQHALLGHSVLAIPDVDGDGLADVVIAAPLTPVDGEPRGVVSARSPKTGKEIWRRLGNSTGTFGWDLALAGDHDGDGCVDVFVGQPAMYHGRVHLVNGKDGKILKTYAPSHETGAFGWYVARVDDLDGDGRADLAVGAPPQYGVNDPPGGNAYVVSSGTGQELQHWKGTEDRKSFGEVIAAIGDLDGDGHGEVAATSPGSNDRKRELPGELSIFSGTSGKLLRHWSGTQAGELYGRMVVSAGDLDKDGIDDVAIGAPWHRTDAGERAGRVELRSGRSGAILKEFSGEGAGSWFGWHIRRAPDPDGHGRPALMIGSLRQPVDGQDGVGVIDLYVLRGEKPANQGTITRDPRRSDIK